MIWAIHVSYGSKILSNPFAKFDYQVFSLTEQIQFYLMQRFPTRQNHDYRMDPNDDPIYDEYTSSGNNVTEEDRHWNFNIGTDFN